MALRPAAVVRTVSDYFLLAQHRDEQRGAGAPQTDPAIREAYQVDSWPTRTPACATARLRERLNDAFGPRPKVLYTRRPLIAKVDIDKGLAAGHRAGSPVIDASGILGQVTRVHPPDQRGDAGDRLGPGHSGAEHRAPANRGIAYGDAGRYGSGGLELRYMAANADVQPGDLLTTSGVDGVYPPGIPVAKVAKVNAGPTRRFARIVCHPQANVDGARHVMVLKSLLSQLPPRPAPEDALAAGAQVGPQVRSDPA
jgi:rod shape-determining protein MreC